MERNNSDREKKDGLIWIKDQKIYVEDSEGSGVPPALVPCEDADLIVDGQIYNYIVIVNSQSEIKIKLKEEIVEPIIKITLSKDELFAYLHFKPGAKKLLKLKDQEPKNSLKIEVEEGLIEPFNNLTKDQIYEKLSDKKIRFGIDNAVIEEILKSKEEGTFIVAKGMPAIDGKDAYIEFLFENTPTRKAPTENEKGAVDYRNIFSYEHVKENEIIAKKYEGIKGIAGVTVTQKEIEPRPPKEIKLIGGKGVIIEDGGFTARAATAGMPKKLIKDGNVQLDISKVLQIDKDIDLETGNINYSENILINGNVCESMQVSSLSNIFIKGNVSFAKISTPGSIEIGGNVISSSINSGISSSNDEILSEVLKELDNNLELMSAVIKELMSKSIFKAEDVEKKGIGVVVRLLLNSKFKDFPQKVYNISVNSNKRMYGIYNNLADDAFAILKVFMTDCSALKNMDNLNNIIMIIKDLIKKCYVETGNSTIIINYALNSEISADGRVKVVGSGCYNTKIYSKSEVFVNGSFIGGEIFAEKLIKLSHVGSDIGVKSIIATTDKGIIYIKKVWEGNILKIGTEFYKFNSTEYEVSAKLAGNKIVLR